MYATKNYGGLDRFRIAAALLVIAIHTSPLASMNESADFFLTRVLARVAVPFFLMVTGQFVVARFLEPSPEGSGAFGKYLKKALLLYGFCILLYLPVGIYAGHYKNLTVGAALRMLVFDGTFYHLWYFPASILGILLIRLMSRFLSLRSMTAVSGLLYVIGLFGDSYYGLVQKVPVLESIYEFIFHISSYTRNGIFFAPLFLILGAWAGVKAQEEEAPADRQDLLTDCMGLVLSFAILAGEGFLLRHFELQRRDSMYVALVPTMYFLYQCLSASHQECHKGLRTAATWIYILHPGIIVAVRGIAKPLQLTELLVENSLIHYLVVTLLSVIAGSLIAFLQARLSSHAVQKKRESKIAEICDLLDREEQAAQDMPEEEQVDWDSCDTETPEAENRSHRPPVSLKADTRNFAAVPEDIQPDAPDAPAGNDSSDAPDAPAENDSSDHSYASKKCLRAWIELDADALKHNVEFLRSRLPAYCRLMPAVKADAYGHGSIIISRLLSQMGVDAFCVACLSEGIALREAGIRGEILILGYTAPEGFPLLHQYELTQSVVDYRYARQLESFGKPLHVHLAIDTGMHRLGIRCENLEEILSVCEMKHLVVDGYFTHLSVSDSTLRQDLEFTESQIQAFYQVMDIIREHGYPCRGLHILASYGILNLLEEKETLREMPEPKKPAALRAAEYEDSIYSLPGNAALAADYVRPGIVLYGVLSNNADSNVWRSSLRPVLSLKARVSSVRPLYAGEATGYGAAFTAKKDMKIATISIGYADGLPRELSYGKGSVLINGYRAAILGRICMDQTIVDVSRIPHIKAGDTVIIIGKSGKLENTADTLAAQCGTITNEFLSRLGARLDRILCDQSSTE